jgi:hypothetical protein
MKSENHPAGVPLSLPSRTRTFMVSLQTGAYQFEHSVGIFLLAGAALAIQVAESVLTFLIRRKAPFLLHCRSGWCAVVGRQERRI